MDVYVGSQSKRIELSSVELRALHNNDHEDRQRQWILYTDALWCRNHDVSALVVLADLYWCLQMSLDLWLSRWSGSEADEFRVWCLYWGAENATSFILPRRARPDLNTAVPGFTTILWYVALFRARIPTFVLEATWVQWLTKTYGWRKDVEGQLTGTRGLLHSSGIVLTKTMGRAKRRRSLGWWTFLWADWFNSWLWSNAWPRLQKTRPMLHADCNHCIWFWYRLPPG